MIKTYTVSSVKQSEQVTGADNAFFRAMAIDAYMQPAYGVSVYDGDAIIFSTAELQDLIADLRDEADDADDDKMVVLCIAAANGDTDAIDSCVRALADAAA